MEKGSKMTLEQRQRLSEAHKGQTSWNKGRIGVYSEETRKKLSESHKGKTTWIKGRHHTEESKGKMSQALKGKPAWNKGKTFPYKPRYKMRGHVGWNKGKTASEETRRKLSKSHMGQIAWNKGKKGYTNKGSFKKGHGFNVETIEKMSKAHKGKPAPWMIGRYISEETRRKIGLAAKGRIPWNRGKRYKNPKESETFKRLYTEGKLKSWNKGKKGIFSEETIKKMSLAKKGKPSPAKGTHHTQESIEKQRESMKRTYLLHPELKKRMSVASSLIWNTPEKKKFARERRLKQVFPMKDTRPETKMQNELLRRGITFQKHRAIIGQPDIFIEPNICVFCDGNYWHAKPEVYQENRIIRRGQTAKQIWEKDKKVNDELKKQGFEVLRFWESDINKNVAKCVDKIEEVLVKKRGAIKYASRADARA
jgi:DNA mismatch endonuclease (patch repair protein)